MAVTQGTSAAAEHEANRLRSLRQRGDPRNAVWYYEDFHTINDEDWVIVQDGTQLPTAGNDLGGHIFIATRVGSAATNDETYLKGAEGFIFNATDNVFFECRFRTTDVSANIAWVIGLTDAGIANTIVDTTGATTADNWDGVFIHKDSGTGIDMVVSNSSVQTTSADIATYEASSWHRYGFVYFVNDGVTAQVAPMVDGIAGTAVDLTISGLEELGVTMGVKSLATGASKSIRVDYIDVVQETDRG